MFIQDQWKDEDAKECEIRGKKGWKELMFAEP